MKCTIVTALYDIDRERFDGRKFSSYFDWFKETLKIESPMVIFCNEQTSKFVLENRQKDLQTRVIVEPLEKVPYYYLREKIECALNSDKFLNKTKDTSRIECRNSLYNVIQYSKFRWVSRAARENYFDSEYYFWIDAGISRICEDLRFDRPIPGPNVENQISRYPDKILYQVFMSHYPDLSLAEDLSEDYLFDNRSYVSGGMFGCNRKGIENLLLELEPLIEKMLDSDNFNNEQIAIGYLLKKKPELFLPLHHRVGQNVAYEIVRQAFL